MYRLLACAALALAFVLAPGAAYGHIGGEAFILVPRDHVLPGETFPIVAADVGSGATISLRMVQGSWEAGLGTVVAQPDGHFETTARLPADFPHGYAQLIASSDDGSEVTAWVLVGPRDQAPAGGPPTSGTSSEWWLDPSVLMLGAILGVAGLALFAVTIRSSRRDHAVAAASSGRRPVPRKGGGSRSMRRR